MDEKDEKPPSDQIEPSTVDKDSPSVSFDPSRSIWTSESSSSVMAFSILIALNFLPSRPWDPVNQAVVVSIAGHGITSEESRNGFVGLTEFVVFHRNGREQKGREGDWVHACYWRHSR
ncbi:hypothetical protein Taro_025676 [Colocasia esculenta]|uniref:Uncharacterized protein n=1 Tax=Colocasia esculenta TaxID=4460 RepID=A0A843VAU5_COLES|nr:hypothetical protein [Colocasia esculenta]